MAALAFCAALIVAPALAVDGDALVIVNGKPISRGDVVDLLMESHGLAIMQQCIVLELSKQETRRRNLRVTPTDVEAEFRDALQKIAPESGADGVKLTDDNRRKALEIVLEQKAVSMAEFLVGMERNAHLRKVVEQDLRVDEALLREEFNRVHGMKVRIRHIQVADTALNQVFAMLKRGTDFGDLASRLSQNSESAALGGELAPFSYDDEQVPAGMREVAFSLRVGEVSSAIRLGKWNHIIKLEERIEPRDVRFEDVRGEIERRLRARIIPQEMQRLATHLFQKANIRVLDRKLKRQYEDLLKRNADGGAPISP